MAALHIIILLACSAFQLVAAHLATSLAEAYSHVSIETRAPFGITQAPNLFKRREQCDQSYFFCPSGTCFTDPTTGYIGCCTASSCAPRTNCIEYNSKYSNGMQPCDVNTGGCIYCSQSFNPYCFTLSNVQAEQWILYCATVRSDTTVSYDNTITAGSQWIASSVSTTQVVVSITVSSTSRSSSTSTAPSTSSSSDRPSTTSASTTKTSAGDGIALVPSDVTAASAATATAEDATQNKNAQSSSSAVSPGIIGAIVGGCVACIALVVIALCLWWKYKAKRSTAPESMHVVHDGTGSKEASSPIARLDGKEDTQYYSPSGFSKHHEADSRPVTTSSLPSELPDAATGLGIGTIVEKRVEPMVRHYAQPTPHQSSNLVVSPLVSSTSPQSETSTSFLPITPKQTSNISSANGVFELPYSPSIYVDGVPGSIERSNNGNPPSLPQAYSASTLPHGLSSAHIFPQHTPADGPTATGAEDRATRSPWAYLSPEEALNGGWRNDQSVDRSASASKDL